MAKMNDQKLLDFVVNWGKEMIACGANMERVTLGIELLLKSFDFDDISIHPLNTMLFVSAKGKDGLAVYKQLAVPVAVINLERLKRLNALSYKVRNEKIEDDKLLNELLEEALTVKKYPRIINFLAYILAMVALARIFGGDWGDIFVATINTAFLYFTTKGLARLHLNRIISNVFLMFVCTASAYLFWSIGLSKNFFVVILTNAFYLVPGIQLINAFRNILCGHEMNGILELLKAILEVVTIIAGVGAAFFVFASGSGLLIEGAIPTHSGIGNIGYEIELVVLSIAASLGFGMVFEIHGKDLIFAALGGGIIRVFFILLVYLMPAYRIAYMTLAAFIASLYADIVATFEKKPATVFLYPSIIPLIPGDLVLYTFFGVIWLNSELFKQNGLESVLALIGICTGFVLSSTIVHNFRKIKFKGILKRK